MKLFKISLLLWFGISSMAMAQATNKEVRASEEILGLIQSYSEARENQDTLTLKKILTKDIDQLVSSGTWRNGLEESMMGMMGSSKTNPGERQLHVDKIRFLSEEIALVDAKYEIVRDGVITRSMWSAFVIQKDGFTWKIAAIRNMLPAN